MIRCMSDLVQRKFSLNLKAMATFAVPPVFKKQLQKYHYFLILDFEATCDKTPIRPQEIIEFPVLKINSASLKEESMFHYYVQPRVHKQLTPFCMELTGITQDMVDDEPHIEQILESFDVWMRDEGLLSVDSRCAFVTCGDWDLNLMLPSQCQHFNLTRQPYFHKWVNIKQVFASVTGIFPSGIKHMMEILQLKHQGRLHSGLDDCRNIATILRELVNRGAVVDITKRRS